MKRINGMKMVGARLHVSRSFLFIYFLFFSFKIDGKNKWNKDGRREAACE